MRKKKVKRDLAGIENEIDMRMHDIVLDAIDTMPERAEYVAALLRACYMQGYTDSMKEEDPRELLRRHGYV